MGILDNNHVCFYVISEIFLFCKNNVGSHTLIFIENLKTKERKVLNEIYDDEQLFVEAVEEHIKTFK